MAFKDVLGYAKQLRNPRDFEKSERDLLLSIPTRPETKGFHWGKTPCAIPQMTQEPRGIR